MAWHYKRYQSEQSKEDRKTYSSAERVAKKKQVGLWGDKKSNYNRGNGEGTIV